MAPPFTPMHLRGAEATLTDTVMDQWELGQRKRGHGRPVQVVGPVQGIQVGELQLGGRPGGAGEARKDRKKAI